MITIKVQGSRGSGRSHAMSHILMALANAGYETIGNIDINSEGNETLNVEWSKNQIFKDAPAVKKPLTAIEEATNVIYGDREKTYGDPGKNLRVISEYWNMHIKAAKSVDPLLTPLDVCSMMVLLKQARLANSPTHRDSLTDTIGYTALADRICVADNLY